MSLTVTKVLKRNSANVGEIVRSVNSGSLYTVTEVMRNGWNNRVEGYGVTNAEDYTSPSISGLPNSTHKAGSLPNYFNRDEVEIVRVESDI